MNIYIMVENRYYRCRSALEPFEKHTFQPGNSIAYDQDHPDFTLEDMCLEMSGYGKGDIREPFVELVAADGSSTTDFVFECQ